MHVVPGHKVHYYGTPVVLLSTRNADGSANLAAMSSAWWLGEFGMLGLGASAHTSTNLLREGEVVVNLVPAGMVATVDRIALTTGADPIAPMRAEMGYVHVKDKFAHTGLTEQPSELVSPPRVLECPIQLEARVVDHHVMKRNDRLISFEIEVLRAHVEEDLVVPGTHYIDADAWDPLIMKFCEFYGEGRNLQSSRLAQAWNIPRRPLSHASEASRSASDIPAGAGTGASSTSRG
ncbi:hypothetical protein Afil01_61350 [Actinorhabdospora filicis]|uniref:Flavin reductase like domain-containing protein n=1 Tax=Actinorhabdospora filicis TaxID=1785913 RepID=A0A9W6SSM0_9ACTN|nr:flavin reductase family protein [Actinorhabdospora filicis]GLZ81328.1 hypothetical protein Afil01_61350 [Actinorhabdospora filicis]